MPIKIFKVLFLDTRIAIWSKSIDMKGVLDA